MPKPSARPTNGTQRSQCIRAMAELSMDEALPVFLAVTLSAVFEPARDAYEAALRGYRLCVAVAAQAMDDTARIAEAFDAAFRLWTSTIRDEKGRAMPKQLAAFFEGTQPGRLVQLAHRKELDLTRNLRARLDHAPHLAGDPDRLDALIAARDALKEAVAHKEAALRARTAASALLDTTTRAFDSAWMLAVLNVRTIFRDKADAILPRFRVRARKTHAEPTAPAEPEVIELPSPELPSPEIEPPRTEPTSPEPPRTEIEPPSPEPPRIEPAPAPEPTPPAPSMPVARVRSWPLPSEPHLPRGGLVARITATFPVRSL